MAFATVEGCSPIKESESNFNESDFPSENEIEIMESFESEKLDSVALATYDRRALEKAEEFFEYCSIMSDAQIAETMRKKAREQCVNLFVREGIVILNEEAMGVNEFLNLVYASSITIENPTIIEIDKGFSLTSSPGVFSNKLIFSSESMITNGHSIAVVIKSKKVFGEQERDIWEVFIKEVHL